MLCAMGKPCSFFPNTLQAKESLHHVMTVVARTLHVAWVDEGKKKDYLLEMKMRKLVPPFMIYISWPFPSICSDYATVNLQGLLPTGSSLCLTAQQPWPSGQPHARLSSHIHRPLSTRASAHLPCQPVPLACASTTACPQYSILAVQH